MLGTRGISKGGVRCAPRVHARALGCVQRVVLRAGGRRSPGVGEQLSEAVDEAHEVQPVVVGVVQAAQLRGLEGVVAQAQAR
jgi:diphthamide synthase subunit DPH2